MNPKLLEIKKRLEAALAGEGRVIFYDRYYLTREGEVYSYYHKGTNLRKTPHKLKANLKNGYLSVRLMYAGREKFFSIHSLVLATFGEPRPIGLYAGHLDGSKTNNSLENLKWITPQENMDHKFVHKTMPQGTKVHNSKLNEEAVRFIRKHYKKRGKWNLGTLSRKYGTKLTCIQSVVNGTNWAHVDQILNEGDEK